MRPVAIALKHFGREDFFNASTAHSPDRSTKRLRRRQMIFDLGSGAE